MNALLELRARGLSFRLACRRGVWTAVAQRGGARMATARSTRGAGYALAALADKFNHGG